MTEQDEHEVKRDSAGKPTKGPLISWVTARPLLVWMAGIVAVVVGGVASAWAVNLFGPHSQRHHVNPAVASILSCSKTPPMTRRTALPPFSTAPFTANVYVFPKPAGEAIFPQTINLSAAALSKLRGSRLNSPGSYDGDSTAFDLTLTAHRKVRILQVSAYVLSRQPPLTGTEFAQPSAGTAPSTKLYFNLDSADLAAYAAPSLQGGTPLSEFFRNYTLALRPGEQQTLSVTGTACKSAVQWVLEVTFLEAGSNNPRHIYIYDNHHKPFQTTALAEHYRAAYQYCDLGCGSSPAGNYWTRG